ncbi:MAG: hypothetical protein ACFBSG_09195 [Leptolyngbyaceae cyanobacterium]
MAGCPETVTSALGPAPDQKVIPVAQQPSTETAASSFPARVVAFEVCGEIAGWERPTLEAQTAALTQNPRYGEALETDPLKGLFEKFWHLPIITFTTYGLSARTEPIDLSGVWTGIEAMSACYEGDRPAAINNGELAEMWLMGYQIKDFVWTGKNYQVTVDAMPAGLQFVQFERLDGESILSVKVIESSGTNLSVASGDW